ncbi:MAG TPA: hypothetical protein VF529_09350 [Solirubrobacteraceae bacterium]
MSDPTDGDTRDDDAPALLLAICERFAEAAELYREIAAGGSGAIEDEDLAGDALAEANLVAALGRVIARSPDAHRRLTGEFDVSTTIRAVRALGDSLLIRAVGSDEEQALALSARELEILIEHPDVGGFVERVVSDTGEAEDQG